MMGKITQRSLGKLIGRMSFSMTIIFGKFPRKQLRPLYQKFHRRVFNAQLSRRERCALEWRRRINADFTPLIDFPRPPIAGWILYTDAAPEPPVICALLFNGKSRRPNLTKECAVHVPAKWPYRFRKTNLVYGLGLLPSLRSLRITRPPSGGAAVGSAWETSTVCRRRYAETPTPKS